MLVFVFLASPLAHDPVVQAKMKVIDDEELAMVEAEAGLTVGLNLTAYASATTASLGDGAGEYLNLPSLNLFGNGVNSQGFTVNAGNLGLDIGTSSSRTWLYLSNIELPAGNFGLSLFSSNVNIIETGGNRTLGNVGILDVFIGRNVTTVNATAISPALANITPAWLRIGPHASGGGLEGVGQLGGYINNIRIDAGGGTPGGLSILGTYIYSATPGTSYTSQTPTTWSPGMQGNGLLGGSFRTYNLNGSLRPTTSNVDTLLSLDIGTNGGSLMKLSLPMAATIKIRAFSFDGITSFGPIMLDNVIFYRQDMYLRNL